MPNPPLLLHTSIDSTQSNNPTLNRGRCFEADCPTPSSLPTATKGPPPSSLSFSPPLCIALPKPSQLPPPKDRCFSELIHHGSLTSGEETPREAGEIVAVNGCSGVHHIASPCIVDQIHDPEKALLNSAIKRTLKGFSRVELTSSITPCRRLRPTVPRSPIPPSTLPQLLIRF
ncbi:hypothetical protein ACFX13_039130 [Malus domestica]